MDHRLKRWGVESRTGSRRVFKTLTRPRLALMQKLEKLDFNTIKHNLKCLFFKTKKYHEN